MFHIIIKYNDIKLSFIAIIYQYIAIAQKKQAKKDFIMHNSLKTTIYTRGYLNLILSLEVL